MTTTNKEKLAHTLQGISAILILVSVAVFIIASCSKPKTVVAPSPTTYFEMMKVLDNTSIVLWDPSVFDFEEANKYYLDYYREAEKRQEQTSAGACTSWRNGNFHGRNLDWYRADYGCLIVQMPKGGKVKHASVGVVNASTTVTQQFLSDGIINDTFRRVLPATVTDGINDAGVSVNVNIVPHQPGDYYIGGDEGNLTSVSVVRYILDNAESVDVAVSLLRDKKIRQSFVVLAGDEMHYMISDSHKTAVVEFPKGKMVVTYYTADNDWKSAKGNPAVMTNFYDCAAELHVPNSAEFYNYHPTAMGVERWTTVKNQIDKAAESVEDNFEIAKSVWYFKNLMTDKKLWYSENAVPGGGYGKDEQGWYYMNAAKTRVNAATANEAMKGYWNERMDSYWAAYERDYGSMSDPHVKGNSYWETSHTVVYDIENKEGYLYPFENYYNPSDKPIKLVIPVEGK